MLIASVGAAVMFWEGAAAVVGAPGALVAGGNRQQVIASTMHEAVAFLFGSVLVIFAYAIALGFVLDRRLPGWERVPASMRANSVSE